MGPIERELRTAVPGQAAWINNRLWPVLEGSAKNLGVDREWLSTVDLDADVLSEAIEAAEALGL